MTQKMVVMVSRKAVEREFNPENSLSWSKAYKAKCRRNFKHAQANVLKYETKMGIKTNTADFINMVTELNGDDTTNVAHNEE